MTDSSSTLLHCSSGVPLTRSRRDGRNALQRGASYILLCRHGQHRHGRLTSVETAGGGYEYPIDLVAERLREQLKQDVAGLPAKVWCASSPEAGETLHRLWRILWASPSGRPSMEPKTELTGSPPPPGTWPLLQDLCKEISEGRSVLVVGHQPQLSLLADEVLNRRRPLRARRPPIPLGRADVVCIAFEDGSRAELQWTISYDDSKAADQVREKIQRKMDIAKLLSGALTFGLTVIFGVLLKQDQLKALGSRSWSVQAAAVVLLLAAVLYFATLYAYDSLLMPERFWSEQRGAGGVRSRHRSWRVARPPSSAAWVLYQNMMRVWSYLFTTATVLTASGIALLGYGALGFPAWLAIVIVLGLGAVVRAWTWWFWPVLGTQD
ncbi:hypothetical protein [Streptomyces sp. NPDC037389]|uniref:hypothetical protein n=1 Tax=Streptomyces sp. NPDC037389 TaxID=3155369 RepID=UPI0033E081A4